MRWPSILFAGVGYMFLSEAATGGPQFFYLAPWIVFFPVIGLLINLHLWRALQ